MDVLDEDEIWFLKKFMLQEEQGAGRLVQNKDGVMGRIYNKHDLVNGKYQVYLVDGTKKLCSPDNLTLKGFID